MGRRNFLLTLAYDGGEFAGWQRGPLGGPRTVQATVEAALGEVLGESVEIVGASRTDAGVHAEGQAASFHSRTGLGPAAFVEALNRRLPRDCACASCREVDPRFHARFRAKGKLYRYRLQVGPVPDPFQRRYSLRVEEVLDLGAMEEAARLLVGDHDFRAFSNPRADEARGEGSAEGRKGRRLDEARILPGPHTVDMLFRGEGFLYNQVRLMAATLLDVGRGRLPPSVVSAALARPEGKGRATLPGALGAFGLCLVQVYY